MRNLIPLLALFLWACGAPSHVDEAAAQQTNPDRTPGASTAEPAVAADADPQHPLGNAAALGVPLPGARPDLWRQVKPQDLLYLKTRHGVTLIEMAPDFAPHHVQRMRDLSASGFYNGLPFHRVIKDFMAQAGDTALVRREPPRTKPLKGEFRFRRSPAQTMTLVGEDRSANTGFVKGFPVASQPDALAAMTADGKVWSWGLHCPGAAAMARTSDPDSANAEFYITTGKADWLDGSYTVWGRVRAGQNAVRQIKLGAPAYPPDMIDRLTPVSAMPAAQQPRVWVMRTDTPAFAAWLDKHKNENGALPEICDIAVPVFVQWPGSAGQSETKVEK